MDSGDELKRNCSVECPETPPEWIMRNALAKDSFEAPEILYRAHEALNTKAFIPTNWNAAATAGQRTRDLVFINAIKVCRCSVSRYTQADYRVTGGVNVSGRIDNPT